MLSLKTRPTSPLLIFLLLISGLLVTAPNVHSEDVSPEIRTALDDGDTAQAIGLLDKAIELDPRYHYNYYILGRIYFNREQYDKAKQEFETALDKKGRHWESLYYLGLTQLRLDEVDAALKTMEQGVKKGKDIEDKFENGLGLVLIAKKEYDAASKAFLKALVIDPNNAEYHINLGDAYFFQGVPSLAALEYEKAQNIDTASTEVYFHWAEACLDMRDYTCAMEKLRLVLSKDSTYAPAWRRAGQIYFKAALSSRSRTDRSQRFKEVIGSYRKYFDLTKAEADSANVRPFYEIGLAYTNLNGFEDAVDYFKKVLAIPYEPKDIYFYYGKALWGVRDYVQGADMLQKYIARVQDLGADYKSNISDAELYQLLGDCYYYRQPHDFTNAIKYYKLSLEAYPDQKRLLGNMALAYHSLRSYGQALEYYEKRIDLGIDSSSAKILKNAAGAAEALAGGTEESSDDIDLIDEGSAAPVENPMVNPDVNYYEVAVDYMNQYLQYYPNDDKMLLRLANLYLYNLADCENGVQTFERVLAIDPGNCAAKRAIGFAYYVGKPCSTNYTKALKYLNDAYTCITATKGACDDPDLLLWIAQSYHLRAVATTGNDAAAKADFKKANEWYTKCLKCSPDNKDCKTGLEQTSFEF